MCFLAQHELDPGLAADAATVSDQQRVQTLRIVLGAQVDRELRGADGPAQAPSQLGGPIAAHQVDRRAIAAGAGGEGHLEMRDLDRGRREPIAQRVGQPAEEMVAVEVALGTQEEVAFTQPSSASPSA